MDESYGIRTRFNVASDDNAWIDDADNNLEGLPRTHRNKESVCIGYHKCAYMSNMEGLRLQDLLKDWHVDANESIGRDCAGTELGNMVQKALPYSFEHKRVYDAEEQ